LRTAAAGVVAARHLAPAHVQTVGVLGAGKQALWQLLAAHVVRPFKRTLVWSRRREQAAALVKRVKALLPVEAIAVNTAQEVVAPAQLVITITASREPLLTAAALHSQLHITAMGSDARGKRELSDDLLRGVDLYVADDFSQCRSSGELQSVAPSELRRVASLSQIVRHEGDGRSSDRQITVADLTGVGIQDTAIAIEAFRRLDAVEGRPQN
jgi:ornithine cyclodeaminase/alanine dehydrogenase-like protein (mu-crystallin family)